MKLYMIMQLYPIVVFIEFEFFKIMSFNLINQEKF